MIFLLSENLGLFIVLWATLITTTFAIESSSDDISSSTTAVPLLSSSSPSSSLPISTTVYSTPKAQSYRSNNYQQEQKKPWPIQSGPINYYQLAKSYNYPSSLVSKSSPGQPPSLSSLMSNLFSPFNKVMSRRVAGGKLFSLVDQFNSNGNANNLLANAAGFEYPGSGGNLEALNDAVNNVMLGLNGLQPNQANQLAGQLGSYLSAAASASGIDASSKNGKKLLDFPKQWYKLLGEKLSGASEAAYSATVPFKESLMNTVKSFYSYIKPSRSQSASPFGDATSMIAAAAAAAASQDSLMTAAQNSLQAATSLQNQNNPKRRQSDSYSGYYYNNINYPNKMIAASQQQPHYQQAYAQQQLPSAAYPQYSNGRYASHGGEYSPPSSSGYSNVKPLSTHQASAVQPINSEMMVMESQASPLTANNLKKQYIQYMGKQPIATTMNQPVIQMPSQSTSSSSEQQQSAAKYDQMLSKMIQQSIQQTQQQLLNNNSPATSASTPQATGAKQPNVLYQKSKEIISRFTKKRIPSQSLQSQSQQYAAATYNSIPMINEFGGFGQRLPSQTIAKVTNKLPSLPLVYNTNSQQQQQNTQQLQFSKQQQQSNRIESTQNMPSVQSQQPTKSKNSQHSYYTKQPMNQSPYGIQPVYPSLQQQQQHTSPQGTSSSTASPMSTSTSVSISMHHSISSQYDDHDNDQYGDNMEQLQQQQQQVQYQPQSTNVDNLKSYLDTNPNLNTGSDISVQNNQGSVYYYYDQPQQYQHLQQQQQQQQSDQQLSSQQQQQQSGQSDSQEDQQQKQKKK